MTQQGSKDGVPYHVCDGPTCDEVFHTVGFKTGWYQFSSKPGGFDWCTKECHDRWLDMMHAKAEPSSQADSGMPMGIKDMDGNPVPITKVEYTDRTGKRRTVYRPGTNLSVTIHESGE